MKFTIQPDTFVRVLKMIAEESVQARKPKTTVTLIAAQGRLAIACGRNTAAMEASVWREGRCALSRSRLLRALKDYVECQHLTFEVTGQKLAFADHAIRLTAFSTEATTQTEWRVFFTSDFGVVPSTRVAELSLLLETA